MRTRSSSSRRSSTSNKSRSNSQSKRRSFSLPRRIRSSKSRSNSPSKSRSDASGIDSKSRASTQSSTASKSLSRNSLSTNTSKSRSDKSGVLSAASVFSPSKPTEEKEPSPEVTQQEQLAIDNEDVTPKKTKKRKPMWKSVVDPATGRLYYYHRVTRETTWIKPRELRSEVLTADSVKTRSFPNMRYSKDLERGRSGTRPGMHEPKQRSLSLENLPNGVGSTLLTDQDNGTTMAKEGSTVTAETVGSAAVGSMKPVQGSSDGDGGSASRADETAMYDSTNGWEYMARNHSYTDMTNSSYPMTTSSLSTLVTRNLTKHKSGVTGSSVMQRSKSSSSSSSGVVSRSAGGLQSKSSVAKQSQADNCGSKAGEAAGSTTEKSRHSVGEGLQRSLVIESVSDSKMSGETPPKAQEREKSMPPVQTPEEVLEGQEVLLIEEDVPRSETDEEETEEKGKDEIQEKNEGMKELEDMINVPVVDLKTTDKKKKRYKFSPKARSRKSASAKAANLNATIQKVVNEMETGDMYPPDVAKAPRRRKKPRKRSPTTPNSGRVVLLPTEHSIQEAAWNEEQARRLLYKALNTTNVEKRKDLCQNAFTHAHDALRLRNEGHDEKIGLVIDPKQHKDYSRAGETMSTVTSPAGFDRSVWTRETVDDSIAVGSDFTYETTMLDRIKVIQALDDFCWTHCGDDEYSLGMDNDESVLL